MNSKIIFWMNDDLSSLGLPKILQEKYNFDIFGIFDITDKPKKFFKEQKQIEQKVKFLIYEISKDFLPIYLKMLNMIYKI